ncbi:MAG TPA: hypothetical protein VM077_02955 [Candidatus Limnocylindrales bacterium]|nr:hypothetical protein [Candidatus Limnocylindrales bacterium]
MDINPICPGCHIQILPMFYFCPNCGKNLRPKPFSISIGKQVGLYLLSFFVPPFGLVPGIKYLFQKSGKAKVVGVVAICLTAISILLTITIALGMMNYMQTLLNPQLNGQIQNIQSPIDQLPL